LPPVVVGGSCFSRRRSCYHRSRKGVAVFSFPAWQLPLLTYCTFSASTYYGQSGHKTLGNWYTTLLNAYGNPIEHDRAIDNVLLKFGHDQTGPIKDFFG
tara:strand:+ start:37 stop:333 length:297 start_codon:yes stop_codon:yes gene_type:complete